MPLYSRVEAPPLPPGAGLCRYGRFGLLGRATHDGWDFLTASPVIVVLFTAMGAVFAVLLVGATPHEPVIVRVLLAIGGVIGALLLTLVVGSLYALSPWGRRRHWQSVIHPYTGNGIPGCSLVSQHWHSITGLWCVVTNPEGNRIEQSLPFDLSLTGQKILTTPDERMNTVSFVGAVGTSGQYKFTWMAQLDKYPKRITVATQWHKVP